MPAMIDATGMAGRRPGRERGGRTTLWLLGVVVLLLGAAPAVAQATEPASKFDVAGQHHNMCARTCAQTFR
jgi:hypothetical protein